MESLEFINQSKSLLKRLESFINNDTNQSLMDIVLDTKLLLYKYDPGFPLLNEINEFSSTTIANVDRIQRMNAKTEYLSLISYKDEANKVVVILNKFVSYLTSL